MFFIEFENENKNKNKIRNVKFDKIVNVILIPSRNEYNYLSHDLWYNSYELDKFKNEAIMEIKAYSYLKHITLKEAYLEIYQ